MDKDESLVDDVAADAVGLLLPLAGGLGRRLSKALRGEWSRNTSVALRAAETSSGLSREDIAEWVARDPRAVPLYLKVLWAAGMNGHDETLRAMGAVLGAAARAEVEGDNDAFVQTELALQAMGDLGPLHFRVLAVLNESVVTTSPENGNENLTQFSTHYVAEEAGMSVSVAAQCLLNLANCGLASLTSVLGDNAYPLTDLGRAVLRAAQRVA